MLHELNKRGIDVRGRSAGQVKTYCPKCAHTRKKKGDPSLSVDIDKGLWNCHHCGWAGSVIEYVRPEARPQVTQEGIMNYFRKRGINDETVLQFQISQGNEWMPQDQKNHTVICFNYFEDGELINIKFKTSDKKFKMVKDAMKIPYNLDSINEDYVIICEGEEECMVWHQVGFSSVVSCPNGASKNNNNLEWLDKVYDKFTNKIIYLATDNDEPGRKLREDLIRRFDSTDIRIIEYPLKDANDCLLEFGPQFLQKIFDEAKMLPVKEISGASEYYDIIKGYRDMGYPVGAKVNMFHTDRLLSWSRGELAVVTGIPGAGKSTWLDYQYLRLAFYNGWKFGIFSPENIAPLKITRMSEQMMGKELSAMNDIELKYTTSFIDKHFVFYNVEQMDDYGIENILNIAQTMIKRHGVDCICLDPFNYIEQKGGNEESTHEKIGTMLRTLKRFSVQKNVNITLVAHPRKMDKSGNQYNVPRMYDISGSHHFFNVPDIGLAVHRDFESGEVSLHVQKVKYHFRGEIGNTDYSFDRKSGRYAENGQFDILYKEAEQWKL